MHMHDFWLRTCCKNACRKVAITQQASQLQTVHTKRHSSVISSSSLPSRSSNLSRDGSEGFVHNLWLWLHPSFQSAHRPVVAWRRRVQAHVKAFWSSEGPAFRLLQQWETLSVQPKALVELQLQHRSR